MTQSGACRRASLYTLGCRLNQAETRLMEEQLRAAGYALVPWGTPADLGVVHGCVVTREAEAKSRKALHRFRRENPDAALVAVGCYAQTAGERLVREQGVTLVLGNDSKMRLAEHLAELREAGATVHCARPDRDAFTLPFRKDGPPIAQRVNLKIQDGCDFMCRYCYIPFARGRSRSRRFEDTAAEAEALARRGARELVLSGVNIGAYNEGGRGLLALIDRLNGISTRPRIRLGSIEYTTIPEGLLERMADPGHQLVPHLHIPLQSGSDAVLRAMGRPYRAGEYAALLRRAADEVPGIGLGADVMVGFPGETEQDFNDTLALVERCPLFYLHVFQYSERPEVASARLPDKVPARVMRERSVQLRAVAEEKRRQFVGRHVGESLRVLFESRVNGRWVGHADNYLEVAAPSEASLENRFAVARIVGACDGALCEGEIVSLD